VGQALAGATTNANALTDWLAGLPMLLDQGLRKSAHGFVKSLAGGIPDDLQKRLEVKPGSTGADMIQAAAIRALVSIPLDETGTFRMLAGLIDRGQLVADAAVGLRLLPRASWSKTEAAQGANGLVAWAKKVPAAQRTSGEFIQIVQTADELAGLLPEAEARAVRAELKQVRVAVFVIQTVREQMRYDTPRIVVEAGKPFELRIENTDFMPHNLVVVSPGQREAVGAITERMKPDALDDRGRAFVPDHPAILAATRLLEAGQSAVIRMRAPDAEGICEYVCTFPGHWQVMYGQLVITKDVDAYLTKHPLAPPPAAGGQHSHHHSEYE
jgi:azurin